jgi:hypothetical protein
MGYNLFNSKNNKASNAAFLTFKERQKLRSSYISNIDGSMRFDKSLKSFSMSR